jgi:DoxX-like family
MGTPVRAENSAIVSSRESFTSTLCTIHQIMRVDTLDLFIVRVFTITMTTHLLPLARLIAAPAHPAAGVARALVAAEWVHEGLYKKVLGGDPRHEAIVGSVPGLSASQATALLKTLGMAETGIALWVLSGKAPRRVAAIETALVVGMNTGGLLFAGDQIEHHGRLVARSAAFLGLVWIATIRARS